MSTIIVTGASGKLGRRIVQLLLDRGGDRIIATTRTPAALAEFAARGVDVRRADFDDPASMAAAFTGGDVAVLISTDAVGTPGLRIAQHRAAIHAFQAAGVRHAIYTSVCNPVGSPLAVALDHALTEAALAESKLSFTALRNNIYTDMLMVYLPPAIASGSLVDACGTGRAAFVTREDCAQVAAAVAANPPAGRQTLDVTGPAAVTRDEIAQLASEILGRSIHHVNVPVAALVAGMVEHGMPKPIAELYATFDVGTAQGYLANTADTVQRLTGRAPQSVRDFLVAHKQALVA